MSRKKKKSAIIHTNEKLIAGVEKYAFNNYKQLIIIKSDEDYLILQDAETRELSAAYLNKTVAINHPVAIVLELATIIAHLPKEELKILAFTEDLKDEWLKQRERSLRISKSFILVCLDLDLHSDLRDELLEIKTLHKLVVEVILLIGYQYRAFWKLVNLAFPLLQKILQKTEDFSFF